MCMEQLNSEHWMRGGNSMLLESRLVTSGNCFVQVIAWTTAAITHVTAPIVYGIRLHSWCTFQDACNSTIYLHLE